MICIKKEQQKWKKNNQTIDVKMMSEDLINKIVRRTTKESSPKSEKATKYKCI